MYNLMHSSNSNRTADFTYGFLAGGLIIGGLAFLFAPKKGKTLRKNINRAANGLANELMNSSAEYLSNAGGYFNTAKEKAEELISDGTTKIGKLLDSAETKIVDNAGHFISEGKGKLNKVLDSTDHTLKTKTKSKH